MKSFVIQPAEPSDVSAIHEMIAELAEFERLTHVMVATKQSLNSALFGNRPACECLIGTEGGTPVAFALFFHNFSTFLGRKGLYLEDLYVKRAHRRKGYGLALLKRLAALAVERQCGRFEWTVLEWNEDAIRFYRSLGAEVLPDWRVCRVTGDSLVRLGEFSHGPCSDDASR